MDSDTKFEAPSGGFAAPTGGFAAPIGLDSGGKKGSMFYEIPPDLKGSLDKTADLKIPEELIASFPTVDLKEVLEKNAEDAKSNGCKHPCRFNTLDDMIERMDEDKVHDYQNLIDKINTYDQQEDPIGKCLGVTACIASLGCYWLCNRRTIKDAHFGFYSSSGRHLIKPPGIHTLWNCYDEWHDDIQISSDVHVRAIGSKFLLTVPENYIGGAIKIETSEYVLFKQGRYVIDDEDYMLPEVVSLKRRSNDLTSINKIGPIYILHIKEGFIGGAYQINSGVYQVFPPGPPYFLHKKDYEKVQIVERVMDRHWFALGPLRVINVKEGYLAGAYHKHTGHYQLLTPGNFYILHSKNYTDPAVVQRIENFSKPTKPGFKLGPYTFITVKKGYVAGAYQVAGGKFVIMPPGYTYQLHEEEWFRPILVPRNKHIVRCGPFTFVSLKPDEIIGSYSLKDGKFVEFTNPNQEYVLHKKHWHDGDKRSRKVVINVKKYSFRPQKFGPFNIITIQEGFVGIFEREGKLEVMQPGFYKKSSEYKILPSIPIKTYTDSVPSRNSEPCKFKTKDSVEMSLIANIIWKCTDPKATALILNENYNFDNLRHDLKERFVRNLQKFAKRFNRDELLPTTQNIVTKTGSKALGRELDELVKTSLEDTDQRLEQIQQLVMDAMVDVATSSNWGVTIKQVNVEDIKLDDWRIIQDIDEVVQSTVDTNLQRYRGELNVVEANTKKETTLKLEKTRIEVQQLSTESENRVKKEQAIGLAAVKKIRSEMSATVDVILQKANNEIQVIKSTKASDGDAKARRIILTIKNKETIESSNAKAEKIKLEADANYEKICKENDAVKGMTKKQFRLEMADISIGAMGIMGTAAWKMPDQILQFYESFSPYLRMGRHVTAGELMKSMGGSGGKKRGKKRY